MAVQDQRRRRLIGVSTKLYFSAAKTSSYVSEVLRLLLEDEKSNQHEKSLVEEVDIFIIPDLITLGSVISQLHGSGILPGAQNTFHQDTGAYTGEVSPAVLAEIGCRIVEVGHAERRRLFGETDADTASKAAAVVRNDMLPLVCIGERTRGPVSAAVGDCSVQIDAVLALVPSDAEVIFAYEPVWAIGAAQPANADHVVSVVGAMRELPSIKNRNGVTRFVYGGSAGPGLFDQLKGSLDGLFLGRFGHDPLQFIKTIEEVAKAEKMK